MKRELISFFLFLFYLSPAKAQDSTTMDKLPNEPVSVWDIITNRFICVTPLFNYEGYESHRHAEIGNGGLHLIRKKHFTHYILKEAIAKARQ